MRHSFRNQVIAAITGLALTVTLVVGVTYTRSASAAPLPTIGTRLYYTLGSMLFGGMISTRSQGAGTTSTAGYVQVLPEFSGASTLRNVIASTSQGFPYKGFFIGYVTAGTGSTTVKYAAACFKNPFQGMSGGTGNLLRLDYHVGNSPTGVGGDIGFVTDCTDNTASGSDVIDNVCTSTGCLSSYTTGTANWNGASYIKFTPKAALAAGYTGRITGEVLNRWGE